MLDNYRIIQMLVPELPELLQQRYSFLQALDREEPIGRQALAQQLQLTERAVRNLIQILRDQDLIQVSARGVLLTRQGEQLLSALKPIITGERFRQFTRQEQELCKHFNLKYCIIVPGDSERDSAVFERMSQAVQSIMNESLSHAKNVIAVTSGTTLAQIAAYFTPELSHDRELVFVPTRGGFNGQLAIQSNTVGATMAERTESQYVPFFVPEDLDDQTSQLIQQQPSISKAITLSKQADCLLLSVGSAEIMAERRDITADQRVAVRQTRAVGEAFGSFFNEAGEIVLRYPRIGLRIEDINHIPLVITIVGGADKVQATQAFYELTHNQGWLVCDEAFANQVLNEATH